MTITKEDLFDFICYAIFTASVLGGIIGMCSFPYYTVKTCCTIMCISAFVGIVISLIMDRREQRRIEEEMRAEVRKYLRRKEREERLRRERRHNKAV